VLRFFLLKTHYRENTVYTEAALREAEAEHAELRSAIVGAREASESGEPGIDKALEEALPRLQVRFEEAMDDDFDTAKATAGLLDFARKVNAAGPLPAATGESIFTQFCELCSVFGLCEEEFED
ncbi:MAG: DALR domain-containing protein, partial [Thermoplasmata archaeon]